MAWLPMISAQALYHGKPLWFETGVNQGTYTYTVQVVQNKVNADICHQYICTLGFKDCICKKDIKPNYNAHPNRSKKSMKLTTNTPGKLKTKLKYKKYQNRNYI